MTRLIRPAARRAQPQRPFGTTLVGHCETRRRLSWKISVSIPRLNDLLPVSKSILSSNVVDYVYGNTDANKNKEGIPNRDEESASKEDENNAWRPMTVVERVACFPGAAQKVWADYLLDQNITDASTTPLNAWTVNHPLKKRKRRHNHKKQSARYSPTTHNLPYDKDVEESFAIQGGARRTTRIPRRQQEQQRRIREELGFILPVVILCIPPFFGYIPMLLAFMAPRQILTRHFFNEYEIHHFTQLEYEQRRQEYNALLRSFIAAVGENDWIDYLESLIEHEQQELQKHQEHHWDAAGPVIDALPLYLRFFASQKHTESSSPANDTAASICGASLSSTILLSHKHLSRLAMAGGAVTPSLPAWMSRLLCGSVAPTTWLYHRIRHLARIVVNDDENLLVWISQEEEENNNNIEPCWSLTELEVRDACLMRGLPVGMTTTTTSNTTSTGHALDVHEMRACLVNHLNMIASVKQRLPAQEYTSEGFGLFTLHLPIIRHFLRNHPSAATLRDSPL